MLQVGEYMLRPEKLAALARQVEEQRGEKSLPSDVYGEGVKKQLSTQFDPTQFGAIAVSPCFCAVRQARVMTIAHCDSFSSCGGT